jgi:hypothetical protein
VTSLADAGPGTLREAIEAKGPRIIVFAVAGIIDLRRDLTIREPFATLAGQSAPGDGICLRGAALRVATHDVIVRFLRVRVGDAPDGPKAESRDGLGVTNAKAPPHRIIIDHCSVSWAIDENMELWYPCHDVTIQACLIAESLEHSLHPKGRHGMGLLVGDHAQRVSVRHNLFAHHMDRSPLLKGDTEAEVVGNVIYNWRNHGTALTDPEGSGPQRAFIRGNLYLPGPQTRAGQPSITLQPSVKPGSVVVVQDNLGPGEARDQVLNRSPVTLAPPSPLQTNATAAPTPTAAERLETVLAGVGAWLPRRDAVDERVLRTVRERTGRIIDRPADVGGWPAYRSAPVPPDVDADGLPDAWETAQGLNPADATDSARLGPEGYAWIEVYLNSLVVAGPPARVGISAFPQRQAG